MTQAFKKKKTTKNRYIYLTKSEITVAIFLEVRTVLLADKHTETSVTMAIFEKNN